MTTFQDAKDSFYVTLRDRLAELNPNRVVNVRGAMRPAVLVAENELEPGDSSGTRDAFVLHWGATHADSSEVTVLEHARCELRFITAGSPELAGMDRGRVLAAMRAELDSLIQPARCTKTSYTSGDPVVAATPVFWSNVHDEQVKESAGALECVCAVEVFAWKEAA